MKIKINILLLFGLLLFTSCNEVFDYSPYVIDFDDENRDVNKTNIAKLLLKKAPDTIHIAFTGDSHRFYDELEDFVDKVNEVNQTSPFDFVIHVGDIADFGLPKQYLWGNSSLLNLDIPYFVLLGNHDMVGNGGQAYTEMFGDYNFSFIYGKIKFVFLNTNSREFKFNGKVPDLNWLDNELKPADDFSYAVVIFHVPPTDADFDPDLTEAFHQTLAKYNNVLFGVHGHLHHFNVYKPFPDSITYVNVYGVEHRKFTAIDISGHHFNIKEYAF
jgi:3',5'-cyclic AMP phosphodiesterase CpdA